MPFLHPIVFWTGLGAVAIPVLIHLLNRRRFRRLDWAAMKFLWESIRQNRRRLRLEELILLALRCGVLVVLATALARFTGCGTIQDLPGGTSSQTVVFLLDDSCSMGQRVGSGTVFSAATTDLAGQIERLSPSDRLAILLTSQDANDEPFYQLTHVADAEMASLTARLKALEVSDGRALLDRSLAAARKILAADKAPVRRLVIYGDFRHVDLAGRAGAEALRDEFNALRRAGVEVVAMDFGRRARRNLTVESMALVDKFALANVPARVRLEVRNHGEALVRDVEVRVTAKFSTAAGPTEVELPPVVIESIDRRGLGRAECQVVFPQAGPALLTAQLVPDELPGDNAAQLALDVREAVRVLAVDGRPDLADPESSESYFFVHALDPDRDGSEGTKVDVVGPTALADAPLDDYDLVALLNVGELEVVLDANGARRCPMLEALAGYVRDGGGLAIFTGDRVNPTFYNGPFYADGSGLLPLRVGPQRGGGSDPEKFYRLDPTSIARMPVLKVFTDFLDAGADLTRFIRFYAFTTSNPVTPPAAAADILPPRVLARFADEDHSAAIVSRQFGRGTVLAFYTAASMRWSDWPADEVGSFVAVLNEMVTYLARPRSAGLSGPVGRPIVYELDDALGDAKATLKTPRHPAEPVVPLVPVAQRPAGGGAPRRVLRYDRARSAGAYALKLALPDGTQREVFFARTVDPAEGDLTCARQAGLAAAFGSEEFAYFDRTAARPAGVDKAPERREYWTWALALLALLLAAETVLAQRFGHYDRHEESAGAGPAGAGRGRP